RATSKRSGRLSPVHQVSVHSTSSSGWISQRHLRGLPAACRTCLKSCGVRKCRRLPRKVAQWRLRPLALFLPDISRSLVLTWVAPRQCTRERLAFHLLPPSFPSVGGISLQPVLPYAAPPALDRTRSRRATLNP